MSTSEIPDPRMDQQRSAVVTGGGSGVGRAVALALAQRGWRVAIVGRRAEALAETVRLATPHEALLWPLVCDVSEAPQVEQMAQTVLARWPDLELLVNAAGTNVPRRALFQLSLEDYRAILGANLDGAFYCVRAFLPAMRQQGRGTIVNVVSDAGKWASAKAGPAYVMSKFGLAGLTQSINAEERQHGIRACAIFPGDIDTPLLDKRPEPPPESARARMLRPEDVAACVLFCAEQPPHVIIEELLVRPR
jgi:NAD(P)-dependent dehydrogenase (short-subunit alcohol dehydrogenase family)